MKRNSPNDDKEMKYDTSILMNIKDEDDNLKDEINLIKDPVTVKQKGRKTNRIKSILTKTKNGKRKAVSLTKTQSCLSKKKIK